MISQLMHTKQKPTKQCQQNTKKAYSYTPAHMKFDTKKKKKQQKSTNNKQTIKQTNERTQKKLFLVRFFNSTSDANMICYFRKTKWSSEMATNKSHGTVLFFLYIIFFSLLLSLLWCVCVHFKMSDTQLHTRFSFTRCTELKWTVKYGNI